MRLKHAVTRLEKVAARNRDQRRFADARLKQCLSTWDLIHHPELRHVRPEDTDPETYRGIQETLAWADGDWERAAALAERRPRHPPARTDAERAEQVRAMTQDILDRPRDGRCWKREQALRKGRGRAGMLSTNHETSQVHRRTRPCL